jgi:hypothetical protein
MAGLEALLAAIDHEAAEGKKTQQQVGGDQNNGMQARQQEDQ